jgi:hypothetical protein
MKTVNNPIKAIYKSLGLITVLIIMAMMRNRIKNIAEGSNKMAIPIRIPE